MKKPYQIDAQRAVKQLEGMAIDGIPAVQLVLPMAELLGWLVDRGLDFSQPRLYVLDGSKALHATVKKYAGKSAPIQRCQVHKRRNVLDHLSEQHQPAVAKKLNAAYAMEDHADAQRALRQLHRQLMGLNPSAARSLEEGLEETLTVDRLHLPSRLRKTLAGSVKNFV